jgi:hypothetical protein
MCSNLPLGDSFNGVVEALAAFLQAILQQDLGIGAAAAAIQLRGVHGDGVFDLLKVKRSL